MAADLGIFPSVAEPLVMVAPLLVIPELDPTPLGFLNPKDPVAEDLLMPEGGFLPSSPLLLPASEGDLCREEPFRGVFPFSEALASSVFPAEGETHSYGACQVRVQKCIFKTLQRMGKRL